GIPAAADIVNLRYKSCPEMEGQDQFTPKILVEGFSNKEIHFQFINDIDDFNEILNSIHIRKEVYQFYTKNCLDIPSQLPQVNIQVKDFADIKEIV
ncbi:hypothetical protein V5053_23960, partial [Enterobacter hormaechei]|uniref:hypothetical protein n=1 Tax=Enterobacter hormaechei TaxID=158836 RepID=UPI0030762CA4